jgi:hypothetical protein
VLSAGKWSPRLLDCRTTVKSIDGEKYLLAFELLIFFVSNSTSNNYILALKQFNNSPENIAMLLEFLFHTSKIRG